MIEVKIKDYTIKDMKAVCKTAGDNPRKIRLLKLFILICIAVIIVGFFISSEYIGTKFVCWGAVLLLFSIISLILKTITVPTEMLMTTRKVQQNYGNSPVYVCFNENNWTTSIGNDIKSMEEIPYTSTYGAEETDDYFFISKQKNVYFCVPKRFFAENTPDELRQLLADKLGSKSEVKL